MILNQTLIRVFPHYCNGYSFRHGFDLYVGRWAIGLKPPWTTGRYMGSRWTQRWTSGWFNWREEDLALYGKDYSTNWSDFSFNFANEDYAQGV